MQQQLQNSMTTAGSLPTDEEEQKLADKFFESQDPALTFKPTKFYKLVTQTNDWQIVSDTLKPMAQGKLTIKETVQAISKFLKQFDADQGVNGQLLDFFLDSLTPSERSEWEKVIFPGLASLILKTSELFPQDIPILVQDKAGRVSLSKEQCTCLLAHMFMCTTIDQQNKKLPKSYSFSEIFSEGHRKRDLKIEKLKCMFNYFRRALRETCKIPITFERTVLKEDLHGKTNLEAWTHCKEPLQKLELRSTGKISEAEDAIEVQFANRFFGGSALRAGAAQEQILNITNPELMIGVLISECMDDREAILVRGVETYSAYTGHLNSFSFSGDYKDSRPMSIDGMLDREIIAIDGLNFKVAQTPKQFSQEAVLREINKAYVGFCGSYNSKEQPIWKGVSTGKWGCGAFLGNAQVKMLVQWIAASRAKRRMYFYTFGNEKDLKGVEKVMEKYKGKTIGELTEDVLQGCQQIDKSKQRDRQLFDIMLK